MSARVSLLKRRTKLIMVHKNKLILLLAIFVFVSLNFVSAIGITPGRTTINFESGLSREVSFSIVNTEHKDIGVVFVVRGDLGQYITLPETYGELSSGEESKSFSYTINLPDSFSKPGMYEGEIVALEVPKGLVQGGATVGATVAVISQVHVYVAYPNKYLDADVNVIESGGKLDFVVPVVNRGKVDVVNANAVIDIYSALNEKVATLETNTLTVNSLERKELFVEWEPEVNPGKYRAAVTVRYDGEVSNLEKEFNFGEALLDILEVNVRDFQLGEIAKFDALVENKWSDDLKDAYLNILVYNDVGEIMADFKSPTYDINALSKSDLVAYWDTAGVHEGTYDGKLILKYGEKSTERNIQLKISDSELEVVGLTGHVLVKGGGSKLNLNSLLLIIVGVLVVANIVWFVLIRRLLKKRKR